MTMFHVLTEMDNAQLRLWRDQTQGARAELAYDAEVLGRDANGLRLFQAVLDHQLHEHAHALLHAKDWEKSEHAKTLPRTTSYQFPPDLWFAEGATRVLDADPFASSCTGVRVHLITAKKYRDGKLFAWGPGQQERRIAPAGWDAVGPFFDLPLAGRDQHLFLFKFVNADGTFEPDNANRLWCAKDGAEIWVHSQSASITAFCPRRLPLVVRAKEQSATGQPQLHLWQEDSDFAKDLTGQREANGWVRFEEPIYSGRSYRFMLFNPELTPPWEHEEARRNVFLTEDGEAWTVEGDNSARRLGVDGVWTLEGDHELFGAEPSMDKEVVLEIAGRDPRCGLQDEALSLDVWVNRARAPLFTGLRPDADGRFVLETYPEVVTSFRFRSATAQENLERHYLKVPSSATTATRRFVVLGRADPLPRRPPPDLFRDPPFAIERPGAWIADGNVRFALHCPTASTVELVGEWTDWEQQPIALRSTIDGTYWWAQTKLSEIAGKLNRPDVHGTLYKLLLNQIRLVQDPAADWVESSDPQRASKLVDHSLYPWRTNSWQRPNWDWLTVFQLHPSRFSQRSGTQGLDGATREIADPKGYLRGLNATAILLMPTCEFAGDLGWGYNPSFFYSVESAYGGPDALKRFVDACHEQGRAVLLDVVFNHGACSDNALWAIAQESFFDGDTDWGAMINFDHPQVIHFFEQNLIHFMKSYRVDGFRFDFTRVIRFGDGWNAHVKRPGSGGGMKFMHRLRSAVHSVDPRCILMAENLPNDWDLTRYGGPMDTQWCDEFHDRLVDASRGWDVMSRLADALKVTATHCNQWYESTNYPESHDEVGNEPNRIAAVAGLGQGLRRNKVAAAATLLSRGIPMWFMGAESGEWRQFAKDGGTTLDLDAYESDESARRLRGWWNKLSELRRGNPRIQGPSPLDVRFAQERMLAFSRGDGADLFVLLNFGDWTGWRPLSELNLPDGVYKELVNSTWGDYRLACEQEDEHSNGGWDAHLGRGDWLHIPDYGVVVLEKR